eukprot:1785629-Karenia_brevis.AAC.1
MRRVTEGCFAPFEEAPVWSFTSMRAHMRFQVAFARGGVVTTIESADERLFSGASARVCRK